MKLNKTEVFSRELQELLLFGNIKLLFHHSLLLQGNNFFVSESYIIFVTTVLGYE